MIRKNSAIVGFHRGQLEENVSLYEDDVLGDIGGFLENLMETITKDLVNSLDLP